MAHETHGHGNEPDLLSQLGYEGRDVDPFPIFQWIAGLFVFIAVTLVVTFGFYRFFVPESVVLNTKKTDALRVPLQPQLQVRPKVDIAQFRQAEKRLTEGYTLTARGNRVTIPVSEAIDELAASGISGVTQPAVEPVKVKSYPGSGVFDGAEAPEAFHGDTGTGQAEPDKNPITEPAAPTPATATPATTETTAPASEHESGHEGHAPH